MILKKYFGSSIQEALKAAKEQLGPSVMLIESVAPQGDKQASVTVMLDDKLAATQPVQENPADKEEFRNVFYKRSDAYKKAGASGGDLFGDSDIAVAEQATDEEKPVVKETPKKKVVQEQAKEEPKTQPVEKMGFKKSKAVKVEAEDELPEPKGLDAPGASMSRRTTPLIEIRQSEAAPTTNGYIKETSVSREISALHRRLEQLESMLSESLISASLDYASHGAFQQLLQTGIRATTISGWFKKIMDNGIDPFEDKEPFMYELAKLIRTSISMDSLQATQPNLVFVGPSGSGKTSLIMKLAANESFFGGKKVALVSVMPRNSAQKYSVLELFARDMDIPYFVVHDGIDVSKLMVKLVDFDHVLFDTPSISLEKKTAFREYWKIRQILASVMPVEVHFVVNATMENYYFREAYATNHPLQPDYVAITHLDETNRWGHLIPFLKTLGVGVRYVTLGAEVPDSIQAFSPTWFAEQVLSSAN
ncbi:hypothetical protein EP331_01095 [bacterium]|nr:MAG: hypothetical protein EP331_01095 [bacterium]